MASHGLQKAAWPGGGRGKRSLNQPTTQQDRISHAEGLLSRASHNLCTEWEGSGSQSAPPPHPRNEPRGPGSRLSQRSPPLQPSTPEMPSCKSAKSSGAETCGSRRPPPTPRGRRAEAADGEPYYYYFIRFAARLSHMGSRRITTNGKSLPVANRRPSLPKKKVPGFLTRSPFITETRLQFSTLHMPRGHAFFYCLLLKGVGRGVKVLGHGSKAGLSPSRCPPAPSTPDPASFHSLCVVHVQHPPAGRGAKQPGRQAGVFFSAVGCSWAGGIYIPSCRAGREKSAAAGGGGGVE